MQQPHTDDELSTLILMLADKPTPENRDRFYAAFVANRNIGIPAPPALAALPEGTYTASRDNALQMPTAKLPDGTSMLLVWANIKARATQEPGRKFATISPGDVLAIAIRNRTGIIVQAINGGRNSWAGISASDAIGLHQRRVASPTTRPCLVPPTTALSSRCDPATESGSTDYPER